MADRTFNNFKEASAYAKSLAIEHKATISLERRGNAFFVNVPNHVVVYDEIEEIESDSELYSIDSSDDEEYCHEEDYDYQDTQREIREEAWEYADSMARSEDEGWFHPDREGSCEDNISDEDY